jgi:hypothetical protein
MITLCSVVPPNYEEYAKTMLESIVTTTKHITNVLLACPITNSRDTNVIKVWNERGINFKKFHAPMNCPEHGHALGLHACINRVETEFIMFCDPDLFLCSAVDELYLNLMNKYNLNYIGCSHHSAVANAYSYFPYVMNSLVRKKDLPDESFLRGLLKFRNGCIMVEGLTAEDNFEPADGKYLVSSPIPGHWHKLPNIKPNVFFDTAVNLCLWGIEQNWRWLSFQTPDAHNYTTKYFRGNFKFTDRIPFQRLIYHDVRQSSILMHEMYKKFKESQND